MDFIVPTKISINNSAEAYDAALRYPELRDQLMELITDSYFAQLWGRKIGNRDVMINRVKSSTSAFLWALHIGNRDVMIDRAAADLNYIKLWIENIGNKNYFRAKGLI